MVFFYSATGKLINKSQKSQKVLHSESHEKGVAHTHKGIKSEIELEYKANGNLVVEKDEKEKVVKDKKAFDPPENPLFRFNHLKKRTPYFEDE